MRIDHAIVYIPFCMTWSRSFLFWICVHCEGPSGQGGMRYRHIEEFEKWNHFDPQPLAVAKGDGMGDGSVGHVHCNVDSVDEVGDDVGGDGCNTVEFWGLSAREDVSICAAGVCALVRVQILPAAVLAVLACLWRISCWLFFNYEDMTIGFRCLAYFSVITHFWMTRVVE